MIKMRCFILLLIFAAMALILNSSLSAKPPRSPNFGRPHVAAVKGDVKLIKNASVKNFGKTIYKGIIDVNPTIKRIRDGKSLGHRNDGAYFQNREGRLPRHRDRQYYREFVHKMKGMPFPGPQRVIIGKKGEVYYTGDHYSSFTRVN